MNPFMALGFGNLPGAADYMSSNMFSVGSGINQVIPLPAFPPEEYGPAIRPIVERPAPFAPSDQLSTIPYVMPTYLPAATAPSTVYVTERKGLTDDLKDKWNSLSPNTKVVIGVSAAAVAALTLLAVLKE